MYINIYIYIYIYGNLDDEKGWLRKEHNVLPLSKTQETRMLETFWFTNRHMEDGRHSYLHGIIFVSLTPYLSELGIG